MFLVLSMVNVSVCVFDSWSNYHVSSKTLSWNYHSPYWHLLLRRELISYRISLLLDPANKLHVTPTDVSGFKTVGTLWTVFLNLPGVNATIVEKLEMFVRLWTKLWMNATVIYYFYGPFLKKKKTNQQMRLQKSPLAKAVLWGFCQHRLCVIYICITAHGETAKENITLESVCNLVSFVKECPLTHTAVLNFCSKKGIAWLRFHNCNCTGRGGGKKKKNQ